MAVGTAHTRDFAEVAFRHLDFEEEMLGVGAHEVTGGKEQMRLLDCLSHGQAFFGVDAQGFLDEHVFAGFGRGKDQIKVPIGLGKNDHRGNLGVGPNLLHVAHGLSI